MKINLYYITLQFQLSWTKYAAVDGRDSSGHVTRDPAYWTKRCCDMGVVKVTDETKTNGGCGEHTARKRIKKKIIKKK